MQRDRQIPGNGQMVSSIDLIDLMVEKYLPHLLANESIPHGSFLGATPDFELKRRVYASWLVHNSFFHPRRGGGGAEWIHSPLPVHCPASSSRR